MGFEVVESHVATEVLDDFDDFLSDAAFVETLFAFCGEGAEGLCHCWVLEYFAGKRASKAIFGLGVGFEHLVRIWRCFPEETFTFLPLGAVSLRRVASGV